MLESWAGMVVQGNVVVMISAYPGVQRKKSGWSLLIGFSEPRNEHPTNNYV